MKKIILTAFLLTVASAPAHAIDLANTKSEAAKITCAGDVQEELIKCYANKYIIAKEGYYPSSIGDDMELIRLMSNPQIASDHWKVMSDESGPVRALSDKMQKIVKLIDMRLEPKANGEYLIRAEYKVSKQVNAPKSDKPTPRPVTSEDSMSTISVSMLAGFNKEFKLTESEKQLNPLSFVVQIYSSTEGNKTKFMDTQVKKDFNLSENIEILNSANAENTGEAMKQCLNLKTKEEIVTCFTPEYVKAVVNYNSRDREVYRKYVRITSSPDILKLLEGAIKTSIQPSKLLKDARLTIPSKGEKAGEYQISAGFLLESPSQNLAPSPVAPLIAFRFDTNNNLTAEEKLINPHGLQVILFKDNFNPSLNYDFSETPPPPPPAPPIAPAN